jgi:hypothetical protein|tara:strand:+ start:3741 stop:4121 length:381 start_codon:yes stop_codon:yes gene_type:complete
MAVFLPILGISPLNFTGVAISGLVVYYDCMVTQKKAVLILANHTQLLEALLYAVTLTPGEKLIALILVLSADYEGKSKLTVHDLVARTGFERRTIYRHMKGLRKKTDLQQGKKNLRNTYYWPQWML